MACSPWANSPEWRYFSTKGGSAAPTRSHKPRTTAPRRMARMLKSPNDQGGRWDVIGNTRYARTRIQRPSDGSFTTPVGHLRLPGPASDFRPGLNVTTPLPPPRIWRACVAGLKLVLVL